jgi:DNA primase
MFTPELLNQARRVSVVFLAERAGIDLRRQGPRYVARCPFHAEEHPSFIIFPENRWRCFGCGKWGDAIAFIQYLTGQTFQEAVATLLADTSLLPAVPPPRFPQRPAVSLARRAQILDLALRCYEEDLATSRTSRKYLHGRGIDDNTIARLRLGYCRGDRAPLLKATCRASHIPVSLLYRLGLVSHEQECFAGMIVVPEIRAGQVTWLTGRSVATKTFRHLLGERSLLGVEAVQQARWGVLAEGLYDYLTLRQWGLPALCGSGTGVTLERLAAEIPATTMLVIAFDQDREGRRAMHDLCQRPRTIPLLLPAGKDINDLAQLPDGQQMFRAALPAALATWLMSPCPSASLLDAPRV